MNFYFITDRGLSVNGMLQDVKEALEAGAGVVQYRDKNVSSREMYETGKAIRKLCTEYSALYIVNDRADIALATEADGVHLGQSDLPAGVARKLMPRGIIGVSCGNVFQVLEAVDGGADYLGVSPIYPTTTKLDAGEALGLETLWEIRENTRLPIVAIGGITLERVEKVIEAGADTVSAMSATIGQNVKEKVREFIEMVERGGEIREGKDMEEIP
ncbi:MAG: thiamine phosphate synthase [Deltaproteobacteria bacterium]|nr:thiamine phosphate synthase [Deltaproteobacteria bacterium]